MSFSFSSAQRSAVAWVLGACAVGAVLSLSACSKGDAGKPAAAAAGMQMPPPKVGVQTVHLGEVGLATELPGRLEAARSAQVRPRASGVVQQRLFTEGSQVKKGQPLFRMDASTYNDAVNAAQAQLAKAQANLDVAAAKRKRYQPMAEKAIVSKQDYDVVVAAEQAAQADLNAAKASVASAQTNLSRTTVVAPISGYIGRALVSEGALFNQNDATPMALIQQTDPLYINFTQSATQVLQMRRDLAAGKLQRAEGDEAAQVKIVLDDGSLYPEAGRLLFTDMTVDPGTGQVNLRAEVPNAHQQLLPGLFVKVRIEESAAQNAVRLPQQAVTRSGSGDTVLVVQPDGSFAPRPVQIKASMGQDWVVTGGLNEGDQVIVTGQMHLMPGVKKVQPVPYQELEAAAKAATTAKAQSAAAPAASAPASAAHQ